MQRLLKSIKSVMTIGGVALVILVIPMQVSAQTGQVAPTPGNKASSSASKPVNAMPQRSKDVPCDPDSAAAGGKSQAALAGVAQPHRVDLSWKASSTAGVQYRVYRCIPGGQCSRIALVSGTSHSDSDVRPSQGYCYFVTAVTAAATPKEQESNASNVVSVEVQPAQTPSR